MESRPPKDKKPTGFCKKVLYLYLESEKGEKIGQKHLRIFRDGQVTDSSSSVYPRQQIQVVQQIPDNINKKESVSRCVIVKLLEFKGKRRICPEYRVQNLDERMVAVIQLIADF